jgi:hypothetical protein
MTNTNENNPHYKGGITALDLVKKINPTIGEVIQADYRTTSFIHQYHINGVTDWYYHNLFNKQLNYVIFEGENI